MTSSVVAAAPSARTWRRRLRSARRAHHQRSLSETFNDLYALLWLVVVYGGALVSAVLRHLRAPAPEVPLERRWIAAAAVLAAGGLAWHGLRALGPLLTTAAEQAWGVSTPVDRRGWLFPRLLLVLLSVGAAGSLVGAAVAVALRSAALTSAALAGLGSGVSLASGAVIAQGRRRDGGWPRVVAWVLMGGGAAWTAAVIGAHYAGVALPGTGLPGAPVLAMGAVAGAALLVPGALRRLSGLDRISLGAGAQLAEATTAAAVGLDPSLLTGVLEARRWRRVGQVSSRRFRLRSLGRAAVLLEADVHRQGRRWGAWGVWAGLALAQYAVAVTVPAVAGLVHLVLAYAAANRLTAGLRTVARAPGLRRALGGGETELRLVHLVVPALGTALWWLITAPAGDPLTPAASFVLLAGIVAAAYRAATRPPMSYGGAVVESPLGLIPVDLVVQLARGPDLLGAVIVLRALLVR